MMRASSSHSRWRKAPNLWRSDLNVQKLRNLVAILPALRDMVIVFLPGHAGNLLRARYYRKRLRGLGRGVTIDVGVQFVNPEFITIGDGCWIDKYALLMAGPPYEGKRRLTRKPNPAFDYAEGELVIGKRCHIASHTVVNGHGGVSIGDNTTVAAGAKIVSLSHHYRNLSDELDRFMYRFGSRAPEEEQALLSSPVVLGQNAGLATNSVMLPGSSVGDDSWVGACSLVSGGIPAGYIAWGVPAKAMKRRLAPTVADEGLN